MKNHALNLYLFGPPRLERNGRPVHIQRRKTLALLAFLAATGREHSRERLAALFWPEHSHSAARADLRRTLSQLQKALDGRALHAVGDTVFLSPDDLWVDVGAFRRLLERAQTDDLARAAALYRDFFLAGFTLPGSPEFDAWQARERQALQQELAGALRLLVESNAVVGAFEEALRYARQWLDADNLDEAAHRQLMRLYHQMGQDEMALRQYERCASLLLTELGVEPSPETVALREEIRQERAAGTAAESSPVPRHNLPPQLTPFIGREAEQARLAALLSGSDYRLVTIVGEGGVGKTRLALAAAAAAQPHFEGEVWFVPLAGLEGGEVAVGEIQKAAALEDSLATAIAAAIGLTFAPGQQPKAQILNYLRGRRCLLLLDNFEILVGGAGLVADLLLAAPAVMVLVTSREPLHFQAEYLLRLEGMAVPDGVEAVEASSYDSLRLFLERAERVAGRSFITEEMMADVVEICRFVGGLPLGIEVAAGWTRWLPPGEILAALEENAGTLDAGTRELPPRHRNLHALFEYSWQLLSSQEKEVLAQLSVFRGPFRLEAAAAVTGAALPVLFTLVDKSLLHRLAGGTFGLHDLLRQFAGGKLQQLLPAPDALCDRHAAYYLDYVAERSQALNGRTPRPALVELLANRENVRQAWQWAATRPLPESLDYGLAGMVSYWEYAGLFGEGSDALTLAITTIDGALKQASSPPPALVRLLGRLHAERAGLIHEWRPPEEALAGAEQAMALARAAGAVDVLVASFLRLANVRWRKGQFQEAAEAAEAGLEHARAAQVPALEASLWRSLAAAVWRLGEAERAWQCAQRSLEIFRQSGDIRGESRTRYLLGILALNRHDYSRAQPIFRDLLSLARESGDRRLEMSASDSLGQIAAYQGAFEAALAYYEKTQALADELGLLWQTGSTLSNLGDLKLRLGEYAGAESCYTHAQQIFQQLGARAAESNILAFRGLLCCQTGRYEEGRRYSQEALELAEAAVAPREQAFARLFLAHNLMGLGQLEKARAAYEEAASAWQALGDGRRALEATAGLASVALQQGDSQTAARYALEILTHLSGGSLDGADDPGRVYLACYHALVQAGDPRAEEVLGQARQWLQTAAGRIQHSERRQTFLRQVPSHREIVAAIGQI